MANKRHRNKHVVKPKRPGPAAWTSANPVIVTNLTGMSAYKQPAPRRHRGPSTAGAISGTGRVTGRNNK